MDLRKRLHELVRSQYGGGLRTPGWDVPDWNRPAGYTFQDAQRRIESAYLRLLEVEETLEEPVQEGVKADCGSGYKAGGALRTKMRFNSAEWCEAWQDFLTAVKDAEQAAQDWRKQTQSPSSQEIP